MTKQNNNYRRIERRYYVLGAIVFFIAALAGFLTFKFSDNTSSVSAAFAGFNAGNIITDYVMSDYNSMSESAIQSFLLSKNPCNEPSGNHNVGNKVGHYSEGSSYSWHVENGVFVCMARENFNGESAAHIIYQAAQDYRINPRVLIVLLEKEQSLVSDRFPNSVQYRSATGYGCPDTAACDSQYYGFKNQVRQAAYFYRYILDNGSRYYPVGNNYVKYNPNSACGGSNVYIENRATSALYQYTPYQPNAAALNGYNDGCGAFGNRNFYYFFTSWFGDTHTTISSRYFPDDSFTIQSSAGKYLVPESNSSGSKIILSSNKSESDRQYKFERKGDYYVIKHVSSGLVVDIMGGDTSNGNGLQLYEFNDTCAQKWIILDSDSNSGYIFYSACALLKAIDIPGNNANKEGISIQLYDQNGTTAQTFAINDATSASLGSNTYVLESVDNKAMDIVDGKTANSTHFHTFNLTYNNNQQFNVSRGNDGLYTLKNISANKFIDVTGGNTADSTKIQLYDGNNTCSQKWIIEKSGAGYRLRSSCSGKAIDIPGARTDQNFQELQIYSPNNSKAQVWIFHQVNPLEEGEYNIATAITGGFVIDINGGTDNAKNSTNIQLYKENNTNAQKFKIIYNTSDRTYTLANSYANKTIDVEGAKTSSGTNVQIWNDNSTCAQRWHIRQDSDTFTLFSSCSDKVLDLSGGKVSNHSNIQIWDFNNTNAQKWVITKI